MSVVEFIIDESRHTPAFFDSVADELKSLSLKYYAGEPLVDDAYFDNYLNLFKKYCPDHPYFSKVNQQLKQGKLNKHLVPMLSIQTEVDFSYNGLYAFNERIKNELQMERVDYIMEFKYDGLGISIRYKDGNLVSLTTRGDGEEGEDVTHNLPLFGNSIPRFIPNLPGDVEIRGEALFLTEDFKEINELLKSENKKLFSNARNAVAGTIRTLDTNKVKDRKITFFPYSLIMEGVEELFKTQDQVLTWFKKFFSFPENTLVNPRIHTWDIGYLYSVFQAIGKTRSDLGFAIDGIVYKVNNLALQKELGFRSTEPRWAVAQKYPPETSISELLNIDVQVGRTGKLTPVARIAPVFVDGSTVTNITLHNLFDLRNRGVRIGDTIVVQKAGDVIPEIAFRPKQAPRKPYVHNFRMPHSCPCCNAPVKRQKGDREYHCTNYNCNERMVGRFLHFVSRQCMNIKGFGEETIRELVKQKKLVHWLDIYGLTEADIAGGLTAPANAPKIFKEINESKKIEFWRLIHALGIPNVGMGTSKRIAAAIKPFEFPHSGNRLLQIEDIGEVIVASIGQYFSNATLLSAYHTFINSVSGVELKVPIVSGNALVGQVFLFTGSFKIKRREEMKQMVELEGGKVSGSVNSKTTCVVIGDYPTTHKVKEAEKKSIKIISEESFLTNFPKI